MKLGALIEGLRQRGVAAYVLSDVALLGASIAQSIRDAISEADQVLVVLNDEGSSKNVLFEAGLAVGLGKPLIVVADPNLKDVPSDIASFLMIRARPDDLRAINYALDRMEGRSDASPALYPATGRSLGPHADHLLDEAAKSDLRESTVIDLLVEALEGSGSVAVSNVNADQGFDVGVWSDDLDAIAANPLLIEIKRDFRTQSVDQTFTVLSRHPSARVALIVYLDESLDASKALKKAHFPVLAISLRKLLEGMRTASFAEVIRDLRNRSVHGV